jgi:tetratricopeptide (TPR) repeat protein
MRAKIILSAVTLCICVYPAVVSSQDTVWMERAKAGFKALMEGKHAEAERHYKDALKEAEGFGENDWRLGATLEGLASAYKGQRKYSEAESLYKRAIAVFQKSKGPESTNVITTLTNLANLYIAADKNENAELIFKQSLSIAEKAYGAEHLVLAGVLNDLARLYVKQRKYIDAEPLYKRSLSIFEKSLGAEHGRVGRSLEDYAALLRKVNREDEAKELEKRAKKIREKGGRNEAYTLPPL